VPEWAIVLVAAFGGGLAGAVLAPVMTYLMQRIGSSDQIRKNRERYLRRMIVARIRAGRSAASEALMAIGRAFRDPTVSGDESASPAVAPQDSPLWQPERISDRDLQKLARRYDKLRNDLRVGARFGNEWVEESLDRLVTEIGGLEEQITARMDELNWPEVDD